ncbi:hypothetical protein HETIRDRAFT_425969 [Heterobasidion irregulare TC 32-1]|uniref:Uncharacterized protein n=1 Tax=Heterobasidion irregulare (strain TC 32-1) TaxID=747525 RepID=W4KHD5_HETIT|nr:uncharacterized protein HETIRDRAFT_425969 [Heterobasidion irregulare TC 32-1]ETW84735.1 hypothetical protein HETIRDRAFT_425969 [Heterobasidion irregulare TC 32-1]
MPIPIGFERDQIYKCLGDRLTKLEVDRSKGEIERMFTELQQKNADLELRCRRLEDQINILHRALVELQNEKIWLEIRFAWMLFPRRLDSEKRPDFTTRMRTPSPDRMSQASDNEHGSWLQEEDGGPINSICIQEATDSVHSSTTNDRPAYTGFMPPRMSPFCKDEFALHGCLEHVREVKSLPLLLIRALTSDGHSDMRYKMSIQQVTLAHYFEDTDISNQSLRNSLGFIITSSDAFVKEESSEETVVMIRLQLIIQERVQGKKTGKKSGDGPVRQWRSRRNNLTKILNRNSELIVHLPDGYFYLGTFSGQGITVLNCDEFQALDLPVREAVIRATAGNVAMTLKLFEEISCAYSLGKLLACRVALKKTGFNDALAGALRTAH